MENFALNRETTFRLNQSEVIVIVSLAIFFGLKGRILQFANWAGLLNPPHHYHNGGIWPMVGGLWVRYIQRLGFHEVACRELVRLAQVNQLGRDREGVFNEWVHGQTGRPIGKAFQAWSAASFLRACHELDADPKSMGHEPNEP